MMESRGRAVPEMRTTSLQTCPTWRLRTASSLKPKMGSGPDASRTHHASTVSLCEREGTSRAPARVTHAKRDHHRVDAGAPSPHLVCQSDGAVQRGGVDKVTVPGVDHGTSSEELTCHRSSPDAEPFAVNPVAGPPVDTHGRQRCNRHGAGGTPPSRTNSTLSLVSAARTAFSAATRSSTRLIQAAASGPPSHIVAIGALKQRATNTRSSCAKCRQSGCRPCDPRMAVRSAVVL
jgi:hypothetical protein